MAAHRLVLVRHAKTEQSPSRPDQGDHGRELTGRGVADARAAGQWLVEAGLRPDLVLCSTSVRTRQTWEHMVVGADGLQDVEVRHEQRVYEASPGQLTEVLADVPPDVHTVALVGHAPGVPHLVTDLTDPEDADDDAVATVNRGFPTMTCAVLEIPGEWDDIPLHSTRLSTVRTPRRDH